MASFAAQAALRAKWSSLVEEHSIEVPPEVTSKVTSVVGWLKQASLEVRAAGRRAVNTLAGGMAHHLVILHFNDVYNVEPRQGPEPVGGAARFCTAIKSFQHLHPLVLFSGDAFSPSMLSTYTKGEQMVPVLNDLGTHCAVLGNHDFDHGLEVLSQWVAQTEFPWLMSNVLDNETGRPLGEGRITHVVHWAGHRIGLLGLVEKEWLDTLATINPEMVTFLDFVEAGQKLAAQLKQEGCDYVIALTHMRTPNDIKLAENCDNIDLILGGHDHVYEIKEINGKFVVKSGTDFRQFSKITVNFDKPNGTPEVTIEEINVTSAFPEDPKLKEKLDKYTSIVEGKMHEVLGCFSVPLDGRFTSIRTSESNLGNWVCDVVLAATGADLVILNSGTFRSDQVHPAGDFTVRDLTNIVPMRDPLVILKLTGKQILEALENGVCMYPKLEGRFPQVAGVSFAFDPSKAPGQRVDPAFVRIGDEYLNLEQNYRLATKSYMHSGCDGYVMLKDAEVLVDEGECPELGLAIQNHFQAINMRLGKTKKHSKHRQSLVTLSRRHSLVKMLDGSELDGPPPLRRASTVEVTTSPPSHHTARLTRRASLDDLEQESCQLTPKIDHRIVVITNEEKRQELILQRQRIEQDSIIEEVDEYSPQN
ncbi:mannosylglucosyl-3-phosphoglycerate phosphatase isoform X1 [Tribolium castaneum]|uniref:Trifunctional nucleotide phosphoesterase protein YfkN-like Protein n=2 Tax=Tribolium castaneum TaxID=7070 RepID=D6WST0_TRICA|nr:PREDICTED: mannosylglucosyl-3-phosphoglycerate phosphatase isoform X1 [Tribolium castaneum]EFA06359.1 Trifunctional nucleotide phosphoesterase protein YfkN-like Protein [Tribolium castaneum]|eukprot:XP_974022.1 PREDICTED: mannosylglucosyl-3-phosphoglycerate phosphatase isoform X1 [Tribolium castaneum]